MSNDKHHEKKLETVVHVAEPVGAVAGHIVKHNIDGGGYFDARIKYGVGILKFFNFHDKQPSNLTPFEKFKNSLISVGADEAATLILTKALGSTVTLGIELGDGLHNLIEPLPNYPRQVREEFERNRAEYKKDPNYKKSLADDLSEAMVIADLREAEMDVETAKAMAKGAHEVKHFISGKIKDIVHGTIDFLSKKDGEKANENALGMLQDMGFVVTDYATIKKKLKDQNFVELIYQTNDYLAKNGQVVKEIKERRAQAKKIDVSHMSKEELVKNNMELLRPYNINPKNLDKETLVKLQQLQKYYQNLLQKEEIARSTILRYQIAHEGFGAIAELGVAINNPVIHKIGQVGQGLASIYINVAQLAGTFGPLQGLAAIHPVLGIATTIFSLIGLFSRKKDGLGEALQTMMQHLQTISSQITAMHQDLINGINYLADGQRRIYTDMMDNFYRVVKLIQTEHSELVMFLDQRLDQIDERLILLNQQLNSGIRALQLSDFEKLIFEFSEALHSTKHSEEDREEVIRRLKRDKLTDLEHWILNRSTSKELNGQSYTGIIQTSPVQNAEILLMNTMLFDGGNSQLSYFVAYLANVAKIILTNEAKNVFDKLKVEKLINPDIWLEGVLHYVEMRQKFLAYNIRYDVNKEVLTRINQLAGDYQNFIGLLKSNGRHLFDKLLKSHRFYIESLQNKAIEKYFEYLSKQLKPIDREPIKTLLDYQYDKNRINNQQKSQLEKDISKAFENYQQFVENEVSFLQTRWQDNIGKTLSRFLINSDASDSIYTQFDRPAFPIARHTKNTSGGQSYLEVFHIPEFMHSFHFEDYDFRIPMSLVSLFDQDAVLRESIPKACYLAEALGLGHFEISVKAHYVKNNHVFTDQEHSKLNQYKAFYNYNYEFEIFFINDVDSKKTLTKIAEFDCHAEQIAINDHIINGAKLLQLIRQRMDALHGPPGRSGLPGEYWWLGIIVAKLNVFNQVRYFTKTNRLVKSLTKQQETTLEQELKGIIDAKLNEIRKGYYQYFVDAEKRTALHQEFDSINISRNLILSFMYLLGFEQQHINQVQSLFSAGSFSAHANNQIEHASHQQSQLLPASVGKEPNAIIENESTLIAIRDFLLNADAEAMQVLKNTTADPEIQSKLVGYRIDNIQLAVNRIEALRALEDEPYHEPLKIIPATENSECRSDGFCTSSENREQAQPKEKSSAWPLPGANAQSISYYSTQTSAASTLTPFYIRPFQLLYDGVLDFTGSIFGTGFDTVLENDMPCTNQPEAAADTSDQVVIFNQDHKETKITVDADSFQVSCQLATIDQVATLQCRGENYKTYVFPKVPDASAVTVYQPKTNAPGPITGDNYDKSSCRPIEFYGKPAVYCEGENTTLVYQPELPKPPMQNLDGQLMLLAVGIHLVKQAVNWFSAKKNNENTAAQLTLADDKYKLQELEKFSKEVDNIEKLLEPVNKLLLTKELKWIVDGVDDCRYDISKLKSRRKVSVEELQEFYLDICAFHESASEDINNTKQCVISQNTPETRTNPYVFFTPVNSVLRLTSSPASTIAGNGISPFALIPK